MPGTDRFLGVVLLELEGVPFEAAANVRPQLHARDVPGLVAGREQRGVADVHRVEVWNGHGFLCRERR